MKKSNNHQYRCAILDNSPQSIFSLSNYINEVPKLNLSGIFLSSNTAIKSISEETKIDFLFIDLGLGHLSGLKVAEALRNRVKFIVFISENNPSALESINAGNDHFILKPLFFAEFLHTINTILKEHRSIKSESELVSSTKTHLAIPQMVDCMGKN